MSHSKFRTRFNAWVERNIIAEDPNPEYSHLDRMNGLGSPELTENLEPIAGVHQLHSARPDVDEVRMAA